jgi:thiamine-monophosphate kinase
MSPPGSDGPSRPSVLASAPPPALGSLGERQLVSEVLAPRYRASASFGDDCAVIPELPSWPFELVATTDPCPEPLAFSLGYHDWYYQGWLLGTINFSDLAAAGAEPLGLLVSYLLPEELTVGDFERLLDGVDESCRAHGSKVLGGNIGDASSTQLTATAIGACHRGQRLSRRGARAGDSVVLVGAPGYLWSMTLLNKGYAQLNDAEDAAICERALKPVAQLRAGRMLAQRREVHAAIDISDGLYPSVESLCGINRIGAVIYQEAPVLDPLPLKVCRQAQVDPFAMVQLWGDWTLLVAVEANAVPAVLSDLRSVEIPCHEIGTFTAGEGICVDRGGTVSAWSGVDAERFTESSWHKSKLADYLSGLLPSGSDHP